MKSQQLFSMTITINIRAWVAFFLQLHITICQLMTSKFAFQLLNHLGPYAPLRVEDRIGQ